MPGAKDMQSLLAGMLTKAPEVGRAGKAGFKRLHEQAIRGQKGYNMAMVIL